MKAKVLKTDDLNQNIEGLPLPRLQLRWEKTDDAGEDWTQKVCIYELVLPLRALDIRAEVDGKCGEKSVLRVKMGETTSTGGGYPVHDGIVDAPFRDGALAKWDSETLNLRVFATCGAASTEQNVL